MRVGIVVGATCCAKQQNACQREQQLTESQPTARVERESCENLGSGTTTSAHADNRTATRGLEAKLESAV